MPKTILRLILFAAVFLLLDLGAWWILEDLFHGVHTGPGRYNYIKTHRYDCLIMGSSTSTCYYDDVLTRRLGISVLNVGLDGSALIYSSCLLDLVLQNKVAPGLVILNIDLFELRKAAWSGNFYSMIEQFRPLYGQVHSIDKALMKDKPFEFLKYASHSYRFNDLVLSIVQKSLQGAKVYSRGRSPADVLGLPIDVHTQREKFASEMDVDPRKIRLYENFIDSCHDNAIRVVFIESPIYYPQRTMIARDKELETIIRGVAQRKGIAFIPITQDSHPIFRDHRLFKDVLHLNDRGSAIFSEIVANELIRRGIAL